MSASNKAAILAAIDLRDLISETTTIMSNKARPPWRPDETTPSLMLYGPSRYPWSSWRDFGEGIGGNAIHFIKRLHGCSYRAAYQKAADLAGVQLDSSPAGIERAQQRELRDAARNIMLTAARWMHSRLPKGARREITALWGITDETIDAGLVGIYPVQPQKLVEWLDAFIRDTYADDSRLDEIKLLPARLGLVPPWGTESVETDDGPRKKRVLQGAAQWSLDWGYRICLWCADAEYQPTTMIGRASSKTATKDTKYRRLPGTDILPDSLWGEHTLAAPMGAKGWDQMLLVVEGVGDLLAADQQQQCAVVARGTTALSGAGAARLVEIAARFRCVVVVGDNEVSGAGEAGMVKTASQLAQHPHVRCMLPPRPVGAPDKVDLADFLGDGGDLETLAKAAQPLADFLIEGIPVTTPKTELGTALQPVLEAIRQLDALRQDLYRDRLAKRYAIKKPVVDRLLKTVPKAPKAKSEPFEEDEGGRVQQDNQGVYVLTPKGQRRSLSAWRFDVDVVLHQAGGDLVVRGVLRRPGEPDAPINCPQESFATATRFRAELARCNSGLSWEGSDVQTQQLLRLIAKGATVVPCSTVLGRHETADGPVWLTPKGCLTTDSDEMIPPSEAPLRYLDRNQVPQGDELRYTLPASWKKGVRKVWPLLRKVHSPECSYPLIAWWLLQPLRPEIVKLLNHAPHLHLVGSPGSGKSTLLELVFQRLLGNSSLTTGMATATPFSIKMAMGSSNAVPWVFDEFKPNEMTSYQLSNWGQLLKLLYNSKVYTSGNKDYSIRSFPLTAPIVLCGERRPTDPALLQRCLLVTVPRSALEGDRGKRYELVLAKLSQMPLEKLAGPYCRWTLGVDVPEMYKVATNIYDRVVGHDKLRLYQIDHRSRDTFRLMVLGLLLYERYGRAAGLAAKIVTDKLVERLLLSQLRLNLDGRDRPVDLLDQFLLDLHYVCTRERSNANRNEDYHVVQDQTELHLSLESCVELVAQHRVQQRQGGADKGLRAAIMLAAKENQLRQGYVRHASVRQRWLVGKKTMGRKRVMVIDLPRLYSATSVDEWPTTYVVEEDGDEDILHQNRKPAWRQHRRSKGRLEVVGHPLGPGADIDFDT